MAQHQKASQLKVVGHSCATPIGCTVRNCQDFVTVERESLLLFDLYNERLMLKLFFTFRFLAQFRALLSLKFFWHGFGTHGSKIG